MWGLNWNK